MPIYYLKTISSLKEFYTDDGNIRDVLKIARTTEFVRLIHYMGSCEFSGRKKTIYNGKSHPDLKLMTDWMLADMVLRRLMDQHLFTEVFTLEFDSGMKAECNANGELIILFQQQRTEDILKTLNVPISIHTALINNPGSLYFASKGCSMSQYMGFQKSIRHWTKRTLLEPTPNVLPEKISLN